MISQESKRKNWYRWSVDHDPQCMQLAFKDMFYDDEAGECRMDLLVEERAHAGESCYFTDFRSVIDSEAAGYGFRYADRNYAVWEEAVVPNWRENRDQTICKVMPYAVYSYRERADKSGPEVYIPTVVCETITGPNGEQRKVFFPENERDRLADFTKEYFSE